MYSPKIRDDLIPKIYRAARKAGVHMTTWVNEKLANALAEQSDPKQTNRKENDHAAGTIHE